MPVYEVVTTEVVLTKFHINSGDATEAAEKALHNGTVVSQDITWPEIESVSEITE